MLYYAIICYYVHTISIAPLQVHYYSEALLTTARILYRSFTPKATVSKGLAQGPYVAARAGVEPTTLWLRVIELTNALTRPTDCQKFLNSASVFSASVSFSLCLTIIFEAYLFIHSFWISVKCLFKSPTI